MWHSINLSDSKDTCGLLPKCFYLWFQTSENFVWIFIPLPNKFNPSSTEIPDILTIQLLMDHFVFLQFIWFHIGRKTIFRLIKAILTCGKSENWGFLNCFPFRKKLSELLFFQQKLGREFSVVATYSLKFLFNNFYASLLTSDIKFI